MQRRIYKQTDHWLVREQGSGRDVARVPVVALYESLKSSQQIAKEIQALPILLTYVRHQADSGDMEAQRILKELS